jgi:hypothetical protein
MAVLPEGSGEARPFLYRFPRYKTALRMDMVLDDAVFLGICRSLSGSGLRGEFTENIPVGGVGRVTLYHEDKFYEVAASVDASSAAQATVSFRFEAESERIALRNFLSLLRPEPEPPAA